MCDQSPYKVPSALNEMALFPFGFEDSRSQGPLEKWKEHSRSVNDRKYVFHFRPKPKPKLEKHLALGQIPKPKPKVQIYVKIGGILLKFNVSNDLSN